MAPAASSLDERNEFSLARTISVSLAYLKTLPRLDLRVFSVHDHACNLLLADGSLVAFVTPHHGIGPFHIVTDDPIWQRFRPGDRGLLAFGLLRLSDVVIDIRRAVEWDARHPLCGFVHPEPAINALVAEVSRHPESALIAQAHPDVAEARRVAQREPHCVGETIGVTSTQAPFLPETSTRLDETVARRAEQAIRDLEQGLTEGNVRLLKSGANRLAGLGPGLTPAGDDFLVGFLAAVFAFGLSLRGGLTAGDIGEIIADATVAHTTRLSGGWLACAGRGEFGMDWHDLTKSLTTGERRSISSAVARIAANGATSGRDALAGFVRASITIDAVRG